MGGSKPYFADVLFGGGVSGKPTFADMGEGGVKKWGKSDDVLNGQPLRRKKSQDEHV